MPDFQEIARLAEECGFAACVKLDLQTLEFLPAVRDMCAENRCGKYGKSWHARPHAELWRNCKKRCCDTVPV